AEGGRVVARREAGREADAHRGVAPIPGEALPARVLAIEAGEHRVPGQRRLELVQVRLEVAVAAVGVEPLWIDGEGLAAEIADLAEGMAGRRLAGHVGERVREGGRRAGEEVLDLGP